MRTMPALFITICFFFPLLATAQPKQFPDSIRIEFPAQGSVAAFELRRYLDNRDIIREFPQLLNEIVEQIKKSIPQNEWRDAHNVKVRVAGKALKSEMKIRITRVSEETTHVSMTDNTVLELLPPGWDLTIQLEKGMVHVYAPDIGALEQLAKVNVEPVIKRLDADPAFEQHKRMGVISRLIIRDGNVESAEKTGHRLPSDMLGLHAGAAAGLVGDRFYPEFNFTVALYFGNRFKEHHQRIAAGYELKLFAGRNEQNAYRTTPATFLSLSYALNFAKDRPRWTALGVGYMVHDRSDLFNGKTMKIFLESDIGSSKLNIVPEWYLTDDLKRSIFGLKLNYKF